MRGTSGRDGLHIHTPTISLHSLHTSATSASLWRSACHLRRDDSSTPSLLKVESDAGRPVGVSGLHPVLLASLAATMDRGGAGSIIRSGTGCVLAAQNSAAGRYGMYWLGPRG